MPQFMIDADLRNRLLEYFEEREELDPTYGQSKQAAEFASLLRDLKALREVEA